MCGLLGEFGNNLSSRESFGKLLQLSQRRGPDMIGFYKNDNFQFGFNRLSILDLTIKAQQPIVSPSKRYVVMCNGEIVNFHKIKRLCKINEKDLRSGSDIEVLSHAIDDLGIYRVLNEIRGMYSIAIFDLKKTCLYLVRDPAGIKPLYVAQTDYGWIFASQYDQIYKHRWFNKKKEINNQSLSEYLQLGYIPSPGALFKNSWMINPGEYYKIDSQYKVFKKKYYLLQDSENLVESSDHTINIVSDKLEETFRDYIHSDVPLGAFLSGGVDSPLVNAIIKKIFPNLNAFSISSTHLGIDESKNAVKIANYLKINHHKEKFNFDNVKDWLDDHFRAYSEPFGDYSSLPTYILCKRASSYNKVLLSGDGGDELFWGYPRFVQTIKYQNWFLFYKNFRMIYASILRRFGKRISSGIECDTIGDWVFERQSPNFSSEVREIFPESNCSNLTKELYKSPLASSSPQMMLKWLRKNEFYGHLQRVLLKVDRASMAHSVEVRVPLLDRNIIDLSAQIIPELGISHFNPKFILKEILKQHIPSNIFLNKKHGFSVDLSYLLKNQLKEEFLDIIYSKDLYPQNLLNLDSIREKADNFMKNNDQNVWGLWVIYSLQKFALIHDP